MSETQMPQCLDMQETYRGIVVEGKSRDQECAGAASEPCAGETLRKGARGGGPGWEQPQAHAVLRKAWLGY